MTSFKHAVRAISWAGAALGAIQLAGCASAPSKPVPLPETVAPAAPPIATMAPIPNPPGPARERHPGVRSHTATAPKRERPSAPAVAATATPKPVLNPARAAQLRARGLEELNRGAVGRAVALLAEASQLDPSNPTIRHDLERAQRVAQTVHGAR